MIFEVTGTNFQNKGAELMLNAISKYVYDNVKGAKVVIQPWNGSFYKRARIGLYQKLQYQRFRIKWTGLLEILPKRFLEQYGIVKEKEINVILDASGFLYSDQWDLETMQDMFVYYKKQKKNKCKIILMPQAFGPFENKEIRNMFARILELTDLVFARDGKSLQYLKDIFGQIDNVFLSPDFTILLEEKEQSKDDFSKRSIGIMPNYRMLDRLSQNHARKYLQVLKMLIKLFFYKGYSVKFFIHEITTDRQVLDLLFEHGDEYLNEIAVITEEDPIQLKRSIGNCSMVIGSRYHGIINSLTQCIPSIVLGWSHKYEMLMEDYNCKEWILSLDDSLGTIEKRVNELSDEKKYDECKNHLKDTNERIKEQVSDMWRKIIAKCIA